MPHTLSHNINTKTGRILNIIIEPVQTQSGGDGLDFTGVYAIYKGNNHGEAHLIELQEIAPEIGDSLPLLEDAQNPEFLGRLTYNGNQSKWEYTGGKLTTDEQQQIVTFIQSDK